MTKPPEFLTEDTLDETGKTIHSKEYKKQQTKQKQLVENMKISDKGIEWLKALERI